MVSVDNLQTEVRNRKSSYPDPLKDQETLTRPELVTVVEKGSFPSPDVSVMGRSPGVWYSRYQCAGFSLPTLDEVGGVLTRLVTQEWNWMHWTQSPPPPPAPGLPASSKCVSCSPVLSVYDRVWQSVSGFSARKPTCLQIISHTLQGDPSQLERCYSGIFLFLSGHSFQPENRSLCQSVWAAVTEYRRQGASTTFIFLSLEAGSLWSRCWQICVWLRIHFLACRQLPSFDILMWQREGSYVSPSFFFYKGTNAILEGSTLMSSSPPKGPHFQIPSQWRLVFNIWILGFPGGASDKESACQWRGWKRSSFDPWARKIPWRRKWQQTPVLLPGKSHRQRSLVDYHPRGHKESDMTEIMSIWVLRGNKYSVHSS